jgi:4-hydroxybenzoate polyprenyltransferase
MILLFIAMNGTFGTRITGSPWFHLKLFLVVPLILSFFFRMRLFDEIKDFRTDLKMNPTRPLPRGVLRIHQVKRGIFWLLVLELALAAALGFSTFLAYCVALGFSLLMYNEFFLGAFLRRRLTTYAVSHTFVSVLLGLVIAIGLVGVPKLTGILSDHVFFLSNWSLFNLFEFARKSYAKSEERESVPTYSGQFGILGSWFLSISQLALTLIFLWVAAKTADPLFLALSATYILLSSYFCLAKSQTSAVFFRLMTSVFLLVAELAIIFWLR